MTGPIVNITHNINLDDTIDRLFSMTKIMLNEYVNNGILAGLPNKRDVKIVLERITSHRKDNFNIEVVKDRYLFVNNKDIVFDDDFDELQSNLDIYSMVNLVSIEIHRKNQQEIFNRKFKTILINHWLELPLTNSWLIDMFLSEEDVLYPHINSIHF